MKKKAFSIFEIFNFERQSLNIRVIIISAVLFPVIGAVIRLVLLADLGMGTAFLTFYPMVMLAALYGGMRSGLIATSISTILSAYWMGTPNHRFNPQNSDFLGIGVFIISCFMISFISEAMIRAKKRLKERTAELIKARDQAEIANKAKSTFLASVSHELRTPLNSILGFSKILYNKTDISEENQKLIKIINRSGEHLLNLINDTLDMAKIEAGKVVVEYIPFNLRDLLRTVYDLMYERAGKKNIEFLFLVSEKVPNVIKGDYTKIRQILINLIGNAIKFTLEGGVYVEISIWEGQNESKLKIAIRDTGIGISQKNLEKIFEPFFQVADSAFQKGTGLGLAITKQFVELLGGELLVESNLHSGSTFTLLLPVEIITDTTELQADDDQHKNIKISNEEREIKVLLVDDEPENLLLLKSILDEAGFKVVCAENGPAGIEIFNSFNPEFIWMDWRMPEMDGAEAVKIIRKQKGGKEVKIGIVSASVFPEQREEILASGFDDFVKKPYKPEEIFGVMEKHLHIKFTYECRKNYNINDSLYSIKQEEYSSIPKALLSELEESIINLDVEEVKLNIKKIHGINPEFSQKLENLSERLDYSSILKGIRECLGGSKDGSSQ